ncbi:c-type cytochrome [Parerythrobacter aestuarii]|uniref:c-type cytochrome n=1 Tax=Parerythrobacter aestuarii TaxID=3020909 RepID=UPI0024DEB23E|nr:cytochrome c [Parerythrobacter aestuarii]
MKIRKAWPAIALVVGTVVLGGDLSAQEEAGASPPPTVTMDAIDVVAARRNAFFLSTRAVAQIKQGLAKDGDLRFTRGGAILLARWAETLPRMFPDGSNVSPTRALDTVWSDREGFEARASAYREAAVELAKLAESGDRAGANEAFMAMADTCKACHDGYREE